MENVKNRFIKKVFNLKRTKRIHYKKCSMKNVKNGFIKKVFNLKRTKFNLCLVKNLKCLNT